MPAVEKKWDASAERDLCYALLVAMNGSDRLTYRWDKVVSIMEQLGYTFTKDAVSQRFTKVIIKDIKARHEQIDFSTLGSDVSTTPRKASTGTQSTLAKGKRGRSKKMTPPADSLGEGDDKEDIDDKKPPKKVHKSTGRVKKEAVKDDKDLMLKEEDVDEAGEV